MGASIKPEAKDLQFTFSFFRNLWSKDSTVITLHDLYLQVISPLWKPQTECYRKLKNRPDRENEAKMLKDSMPVVIAEGICRPNHSHAAANLISMSLLAMYDLDHADQRTPTIKELFRQLPYVAYTHTSISGEGLKVFVYLDARTSEEYPLAYAICQHTLERIAAHPCDPQCARITQPCSCVCDPEAYLNPNPTPYPWREELATDPSLQTLVRAIGNSSGNHPYDTYPSGNSNGQASPIPPTTEACGYIESFIRTFAQYHPWQKGNRHESMLALGRSARRKGFSKNELEKLILTMAAKIVSESYSLQELQKDISSGYQYIDLSYIPQKGTDSALSLSTLTFTPSSLNKTQEQEEDMSINDEKRLSSTPLIPEEVFEHLPDFIHQALKVVSKPRGKDILLLGILANLSACMPQVSIVYDQCPYSPHLYVLVVANSAAGKGPLSLANILPTAIDKHLQKENKRKKADFERELQEWEQCRSSHKGGRTETAGNPSRPEEPDYYHLCGSPNTSKNQLISRLKSNGSLGLIIAASELDTVSGSIKQDYGKHDDVFRAAFHHEPVSTDFKTDKELICAEEPHLALCLSGTPDQLPAFIHSSNNGTYSRFTIYACVVPWEFRSAAPHKGEDNHRIYYKELSKKVLDMFLFFQQSPTEVTFSDQQWEEHTNYFSNVLDAVASERANAPGSIVLRSALVVARIASILTALRKFEGGMQMKEYRCSDEDFHAAMQIVKTTLQHSLLLESSLPGDNTKAKPLQSYFRIGKIFNELPDHFTLKEIKEKALSQQVAESSLYRYLLQLIKTKHLEKQDNIYHKLKKITLREA